MNQEKDEGKQERMLSLGAWLGRHQAFGLIVSRCSAADAECLKAIRDGGEYKQLGLSWEEFCEKHAGVSRFQANRQIHYLEEFGVNYFRLSEVMAISPDTYRLIAGAVTEAGIECDGERVAMAPENRGKIAAAVKAMRSQAGAGIADGVSIGVLRKKLDALLADAHHCMCSSVASQPDRRLELIGLLDEGRESLERLTQALRDKTLILSGR
jgi:hypothetical protein